MDMYLLTADPETRQRIAEILEREPIRELKAASKEGRVDRVIQMVAAWPEGKYDDEVWYTVRDLARTLNDLHVKQGGERIKVRGETLVETPTVVCLSRITEATAARDDRIAMLRCKEMDVDIFRLKPGESKSDLTFGAVIVAGGNVRLRVNTHIIFAGGSVELLDLGEHPGNAIIVSGGDVTVQGELFCSLVIARGKVVSKEDGRPLEGNRIISGKSVKLLTKRPNVIVENESNPLGFIRWGDASKGKPSDKSK